MDSFIPNLRSEDSEVPFFEDSSRYKVPGRGTEKTVVKLQQEVREYLAELGAFAISIIDGQFAGIPKRYGYRILFQYANARGRMDILALPLRNDQPHLREKANKQALYLLRDKLQAQFYARMYEPNGASLIPYLIGAQGKTVIEAVSGGGELPLIESRVG